MNIFLKISTTKKEDKFKKIKIFKAKKDFLLMDRLLYK